MLIFPDDFFIDSNFLLKFFSAYNHIGKLYCVICQLMSLNLKLHGAFCFFKINFI